MLDAGPVDLLANPSARPEAIRCLAWFDGLPVDRVLPIVSEIADYEVRRELLLAGRTTSISRLNSLISGFTYLSIDTATMRRAAELWAQARQRGRPTADPAALDADVILASQAQPLVAATTRSSSSTLS